MTRSSTRVYRPPWTAQRAIALLREQSGTAFDPRCIETLELLIGEQLPAETAAARVGAAALAAEAPADAATRIAEYRGRLNKVGPGRKPLASP